MRAAMQLKNDEYCDDEAAGQGYNGEEHDSKDVGGGDSCGYSLNMIV